MKPSCSATLAHMSFPAVQRHKALKSWFGVMYIVIFSIVLVIYFKRKYVTVIDWCMPESRF